MPACQVLTKTKECHIRTTEKKITLKFWGNYAKIQFFGSFRHDQMLVQSQIVFINFPSPKVWDEADYVVPPAENGAFFVTTNVVITPNQTWGECPEVWIVHDQHHKYHGYHLHHQCCYKSYQSSHFVMSRGVHQTFSNIIISETHSSSFLDYIVNKYTLNNMHAFFYMTSQTCIQVFSHWNRTFLFKNTDF